MVAVGSFIQYVQTEVYFGIRMRNHEAKFLFPVAKIQYAGLLPKSFAGLSAFG